MCDAAPTSCGLNLLARSIGSARAKAQEFWDLDPIRHSNNAQRPDRALNVIGGHHRLDQHSILRVDRRAHMIFRHTTSVWNTQTKGKRLSIFHCPWWLDAAAPGAWRESVVTASDGRLRARWPYVVERRRGMTWLLAPPLTFRLGPLLMLSETRQTRRISEQKELLLALADQLPPHDYFSQKFDPAIDYWMPLSWRGFTQTALYSYTLDDLSDLDSIWGGFTQRVRSSINKAKRSITVQNGLPSGSLYDVVSDTLRRNGTIIGFDRETLLRVHDQCIERDRGKVFSAHNRDGDLVAALFLVWDKETAYYLLGGAGEEARRTGAPSLLLWEAIQFAATVTQKFDFEGSRIESIEDYFRSFGGRPIPYSQVERRNNRAQVLLTARDLIRHHDRPVHQA